VNGAELYAALTQQLTNGGGLTFWQSIFVGFYKAFLDGSRWKLYLKGVGTTIEVTLLALLMGIVLGVLVAVVRTSHDQQRPGRRNPVLGFLNAVCTVYTTVIRGHPHDGPAAHHGLRHLRQQPQLHLGRHAGAGHQLRRIRGGDRPQRPDVHGPGQMEAGRSLGLGYVDTMRFIIIPQAFKNILPGPGQRVHHPLQGHRPHHRHRRQGAALRRPGGGRQDIQRHVPVLGGAFIYLVLVMLLYLAAGQTGKEAASK
jgi:hypothetical protein